MDRVLVFQLLLCCACVSSTVATNVKIYGLESKTKVEKDYIVVLKRQINDTNKQVQLQSLEKYTKDISTTEDNSIVVSEKYSFGNFAALRVHLSEDDIHRLSEHYDVDFIQANQKVRINQAGTACAAQSTGSSLWGLSRLSTHEKPNYNSAKYKYLVGDGQGVDVYIVDTGVYIDHEDLKGRAQYGFTASSHTTEGAKDMNGHGTHVAGIVAGKFYGVAKSANIIAVKVLGKDGSGTTADIIEGLQWVHQDFTAKKTQKGKKAKAVVNMSLGGVPGQVGTADELAITELINEGVTFSVAAGNDNYDACYVSPARLSTAITVAATNISDIVPVYSNFGPCVDILAPGDAVRSSYIGSTTATAVLSGTSMSAPYVAGTVARYLSQLCDAPSPAAIKAWLQDTATQEQINLSGKASTANKLVYMECLADSSTAPSSPDFARSAIEEATGYDATFWMLVAMAAIMIICISGFIVSCVTLSRVKKVQRDQKHLLYTQLPRGYQSYQETSRLLE